MLVFYFKKIIPTNHYKIKKQRIKIKINIINNNWFLSKNKIKPNTSN